VTPQEARAMVADLHVGIEIAGSPVADINALGPLASIACFGNNNGAILGPRIAAWHAMDLDALPCTARIDGLAVGQGTHRVCPAGSGPRWPLRSSSRRGSGRLCARAISSAPGP
jgi:2-keto-4-pentenoate hydratase